MVTTKVDSSIKGNIWRLCDWKNAISFPLTSQISRKVEGKVHKVLTVLKMVTNVPVAFLIEWL